LIKCPPGFLFLLLAMEAVMSPGERNLVRDIVLVVIVKLLAIAALWWYFVRDARISVDAPMAADHFGASASPAKLPAGNPNDQ